MTLIPVKTPALAKKVFPNYIWNIPNDEGIIYLTFDDGPTEEVTEWVLEQLKMYNAKATFFCIGNNVENYPNIFQKILKGSHSIGNHTHNHLKGWKTRTMDYLENFEKCESVLKSEMSKFKIQDSKFNFENLEFGIWKLFRPPYGKMKPKQGKQLLQFGYKIIMWDVLSFDWDNSIEPKTCLNNVISKVESGSIIVFHDSKKAFKNLEYALPKVLKHFSRKGFQFKAIEN